MVEERSVAPTPCAKGTQRMGHPWHWAARRGTHEGGQRQIQGSLRCGPAGLRSRWRGWWVL